ncbi:MAG: thymidine phosphorylase [Candidatus Merdivicinus sp.]|jgi:pyrimidine-nucleoside phosphorylase
MRIYDLILKKRNGGELSKAELEFLVNGVVSGEIPDYQLSAWLMAVWFRGMTPSETAAFTMAMANSGDRSDLSALEGHKIDKHSTGGVGDKTTLVAIPIAAACGVLCPKMSGRGLGHTGGTADKLEAIPGFRTGLSETEFFDTVRKTGMSLMTQTGNLAPADKKLYALRDVTATVDSLPLIAASVMSKKLASGCDGVVLDVKVGSGAFMKTAEDAAALAKEMLAIGKSAGIRTSALITDMDLPLGNTVGNAIEVNEAMETLRGGGPSDLRQLSLTLAAEMIRLSNGQSASQCMQAAQAALKDGRAFVAFQNMVACQGGDPEAICQPLPLAACTMDILADQDGYLTRMQTDEIGNVSVMLGAGRSRKEDSIDLGAGIRIFAKTGDYIQKGDVLARLYASNKTLLSPAAERYRQSLFYGEEAPSKQSLILSILTD